MEKPTVTLRNSEGAQVTGARVDILTEKGSLEAPELYGDGYYSFDLPEGASPKSLKVKISHPDYQPINLLFALPHTQNHLVLLARPDEFYFPIVDLIPLGNVEEVIEFTWDKMAEVVPSAAQKAEIARVNALQEKYGKKGALPQFGSRVKNEKVNPNHFLGEGWDNPPYTWLPDDAVQRKALLAKMEGFKYIRPMAVHFKWDNNYTFSANVTKYSIGFKFPAEVKEAEIKQILEPLGFRVKYIHPPMIGLEYYHIAYADYAGIPTKEMMENATGLMNKGLIYGLLFNSCDMATY